MTTDRHACGLSSFLPMSCRGRAEAFARRLQSRLQSLGRQPSDDPHDTEESWLTTSQQAFPTARQPRLSSSSESDIYFDFDCDFGSPESPQEEATEAIHLNRRRGCDCILEGGQDAESGCATASTATATSPGSSDGSDHFYDVETPLNDDLSALIDSTLQQSCCHVRCCNGYDSEPACLDCGCRDESDVTFNGHPESHGAGSKLSSSSSTTCGSESETTPTNETGGETFGTVGVADEVDDADLRRYRKRARKPRVDYTHINGLQREHPHRTTETHENKTKAQEADAVKYETEATETNETEEKAQEETEEHEVVTSTPETETIETEAATHEVEEEAHLGEADTREDEAETNETETKAHEEGTDTHDVQSETNETETIAHEGRADTPDLQAETNETETIAHEGGADTHDLQAETNETETIAHEGGAETYEAETIAHVGEADTHDVTTETYEAETKPHVVETEDCEGETDAHEAEPKAHEEVEDCTESPEAARSPTGFVYKSSMLIQSGVEECCDDNFLSSLNFLKQELLIECPVVTKTRVPDVEITEATPSTPGAAPPKPPAKEEGASKRLEVDDDIEDDRPQRVRRCSSLKTGKTPPGTPGRKKIVRFADVLGLDLADVRTFLDEVPKVPNSAYEDLQYADFSLGSSSSIGAVAASLSCTLARPDKLLVPLFVQPGGSPDFLDRVREQQVCLENAVVNDAMLGTISGTVRVRNLDFHKSVHVRYSVDEWKTFSDLQASYVQNSCDGFSDTFSFTMYAHHVAIGQRLEFAVRFQCHGCQYWDSNRGANYAFQCLPPAGQSPFRPPPMSTCPDEQWASFY